MAGKLRGLPALTLIWASFGAGALEQIGLEEVWQAVKTHDPALRSAGLARQIEQERLIQSRSGLLPDISLDAQYIQTQQDILSADNAVFSSGKTDYPTKTYTISLTQPLFNWSALQDYRAAKIAIQARDAEQAEVRLQSMRNAAERYFEVLAARDAVRYRKAELTALQKEEQLLEEKFSAGLTGITELSDVRARRALAEADLVEAAGALDDTRQALWELMGTEVKSLMKLGDQVPLLRPDPETPVEWVQRTLDNNPQLVRLRLERQRRDKIVESQQAGHYPTLDLVLRHNYRKTDGTLFGGGSEVGTSEALVQLTLPLYKGGETSSAVRQARFESEQANEELTKVQRERVREVRAAFSGVLTALSRIEALKASVVAQEQVVDGRRRGLKSGLYTQVDVLDAERDWYAAQRDLAQARYDYVIESLRLKAVSGILSENDIQTMNTWLQAGL